MEQDQLINALIDTLTVYVEVTRIVNGAREHILANIASEHSLVITFFKVHITWGEKRPRNTDERMRLCSQFDVVI
jgi:hypothetical protein